MKGRGSYQNSEGASEEYKNGEGVESFNERKRMVMEELNKAEALFSVFDSDLIN